MDGINSYTCHCRTDFTGTHCEQSKLKNGSPSYFGIFYCSQTHTFLYLQVLEVSRLCKTKDINLDVVVFAVCAEPSF